jgi:hypothetical protein
LNVALKRLALIASSPNEPETQNPEDLASSIWYEPEEVWPHGLGESA